MRLSGERVRQLERTGSNKYEAGMRARGMAPEDDGRRFGPRPKSQYEIEADEEEEATPKAPRVMRGTLFDGTEAWQTAERSRVAKAPKKSEPKREEREPETTGTLALFGSEGEW
jgi:hypothetical protein